MPKIIFPLILFLSVSGAYAQEKVANPGITATIDAGFQFTSGIDTALFFRPGAEAEFGKWAHFGCFFTAETEQPYFSDVQVFYRIAPFSFLDAEVRFLFRNYSMYNTAEYNPGILLDIHYRFRGGTAVFLKTGLNFRFSVYTGGITSNGGFQYITDFNWALRYRFFVRNNYSAAVEVGTMPLGEFSSFGYIQTELLNTVALDDHWTVNVSTGIGFAGSLSLAGNVDRYWLRAGVRYAL